MNRFCLFLAAWLLTAAVAFADHGYTFNNGFWWKGGQSFTRAKVAANNCYGYAWRYSKADYNQPGVNVKVVNNLIGIPVPFTYGNSIAAQGTTYYGYSQQADLSGYGLSDDVELSLLYSQASRFTEQAIALGGDANAGFQTLVATEAGRQSQKKDILAAAVALERVLTAGQARSQRTSFNIRAQIGEDGQWHFESDPGGGYEDGGDHDQPAPGAGGQNDPPPQPGGGLTIDSIAPALQQTISTSCAECHSGENIKGGIDLTKILSYTVGEMDKLIAAIESTDEDARMPKGDPALSGDAKAPFYVLREILRAEQ